MDYRSIAKDFIDFMDRLQESRYTNKLVSISSIQDSRQFNSVDKATDDFNYSIDNFQESNNPKQMTIIRGSGMDIGQKTIDQFRSSELDISHGYERTWKDQPEQEHRVLQD